jgi:hypothetical protein
MFSAVFGHLQVTMLMSCTNEKITIACRAGSLLRFEREKSGVGGVPALRASVDCGCVEFCLVWMKKDVDATTLPQSTEALKAGTSPTPDFSNSNRSSEPARHAIVIFSFVQDIIIVT